ncbi:TPM domain-containing protein [Nonomuraea sp. NPDC050556]|uniref:TPM domain-containing protein n=1 Tax=Nonomuraea sp. NPDC050556 TaxID=3364369 RepID=UPI00378EB9BA
MVGALLCLSAPAAFAEKPGKVTETVTDRQGVLGDRTAAVESSIGKLYDDTGLRLYVVYVKNFSGMNATTWADDTAEQSGLGRDDLLMAVATAERRYAVSADTNAPLTDAQLKQVAQNAIVPALRQGDWAAAAIGAADGYGRQMAATSAGGQTGGQTGEKGSGAAPLIVGGVLVAGGVGGYLYYRRRKSTRTAATFKDLETRAGQALVHTDDAVKTSEQEIGFAAAQFGDDATQRFSEALEYAKGELNAAFHLRQQLDDEIPEDDATRKAWLEEIVQRCAAANARLDAESEGFDRLRDLEGQAPQVLAEVERAQAELAPKVDQVRQALAETAQRYAPTAITPVEGNPDEAASRLEFAAQSLGEARAAIQSGDNGKAVVPVLAAQSAVDQAKQLLEAVTRRADDLDRAAAGLKPALEAVAANLAAAKAVAADDRFTADLSAQIAFAESAATQVATDVVSGPVDPIALLRRVEEAQNTLDQGLSGVRDKKAREEQAASMLSQAQLAARSEISATKDFITTNRGAVGSTARTRLAEAERLLTQATKQATTDPVGALAAAQRADQLAQEAGSQARGEVSAFGARRGTGGSGGGAAMGAVLGGILIESMMSGSRQPSRQRTRRADPAPGSFGGARTRGRRGTGGSF